MRTIKLPAQIGFLVAALFVLGACAPAAAPSPTAAPARPAEKTTQQPAAKPTQKPAAEQPMAKPTEPAAKAALDETGVAEFYKGKTIRIIVGFSAGGGYDTYSRTIAEHLGKFIPGNPNVIVENMPGAGSMVAANFVYNAAPKDGTVIGNFGGPLILEQLFETKSVEFDMAKFGHLAVPVPETYVMVVASKAGAARFEDVLGPNGKQIVMGGIPGSTVEHAAVLVKDTLGANFKVVSGYQGTSKIRLALQSDEVEGFFNTWQSVKITNSEDVQTGNWLVLLQLSDKPLKDLPGQVPTILDVATTEEQRQLLLFGTSYPNQFGKLYAVAPEVPPERAAALETALLKTMADQAFLADAQKSKLEIDPMGGEAIKKLVVQTLGMPEAVKAKLKAVMKAS